LRVDFATADIFHREHSANLAKGGVFVPTRESFALREIVGVELALEFCKKRVLLKGEVVHIVTPELAVAGASPGIAVHFAESSAEVRRRLAPLVAACGSVPPPPIEDGGRRAAPRVAVRIPVRIDGDGVVADALTRNLSQTGALVTVDGAAIEPGRSVRLAFEHPGTGEVMEVVGRVAREIETGGEVAALGIEFQPDAERRGEVARFIEQVQAIEHTRRLGGISGSIAELGAQNLVQMLGSSAQEGTLVMRLGEDEGVIGFHGHMLRSARLGSATGMKALVRLLAWVDGTFEFCARLERDVDAEAPLPLVAAIFEAVRGLDEMQRLDLHRLPLDARVRIMEEPGSARDGGDSLSKIEAAVVDLARVGFTVQRIVDVIPETDPEILRAVASLADRGVIQLEN
jgi:Tfp pilus assembly protein PilZ